MTFQAAADYVPQTDQSLVTKANILDTDINAPTTPNVTLRYDAPSSKWVDSGAGSVIVGSRPLSGWGAGTVGEALEYGLAGATLPISSVDGTVTLDGSSNTFSVTTASVERLRAGVAVDDSAYLMIGDTLSHQSPVSALGQRELKLAPRCRYALWIVKETSPTLEQRNLVLTLVLQLLY